jgi:probable F420-dependent oxidoreductase
MRIGVVFPQTEIGNDPAAIRDYAQAAEAMGYTHILAYDHVLGASTAHRPDWKGAYTSETPFHEVFVLFGYLAAVTRQVELVTGVLVLPQRQTALVAKQAASLDVLSSGRLRLGVGIGWNAVEYEALNEDFHTRGARSAEQIAVLHELLSKPVVDFHGRYHHIPEAGINPLPVRQPVPIWGGGTAEAALKRIGTLCDGWFPQGSPTEEMREAVARLRGYASEAGRAPESVGIEARLNVSRTPQSEWATFVQEWGALGATHIGINTMGAGLTSPQAHIDKLRDVKQELDF